MRHGRDLDSLDRWIDEKEYRNRNIESQQQRFTCWHCGSELVWGGDHDLEQEDYDIVSNFSCMNCKTYVEVYHKCQ
jgi:transcription elongation factor Elf1